jgi:SAM-dependent methyltransferase
VSDSQQKIDGQLPQYWDGIVNDFPIQSPPMRLWRVYMRQNYARLINVWLGGTGRWLKTDLFEEAISEEGPLEDLGAGSFGVDASEAAARAAYQALLRRGIPTRIITADLRHLPLRAQCMTGILSGSSLDHFADKREIDVCLAELRRILAPGGVLAITFDNPHNPVVWLRNILPFRWLNRMGLVPYYVGATYRRGEAQSHLTALGFKVTHVTAIAHAPRIAAMWLIRFVEWLKWPAAQRAVLNLMRTADLLERLPTRFITGYYIALRAEVEGV